jgi:hypothetical protein
MEARMRRLRLGTTGFAFALLLMVPRAASAGMGEIIDVIIGLTGPQMVGAPIACELDLGESRDTACYFAGVRFPRPRLSAKQTVRSVDDTFWTGRNLWVSLGGGVYGSSPKDSEMRDFEFARVWMLAFEPTLNYRSVTSGKFVIEHGAGPSVLSLFGKGFDSFVKGGIKVTPVAVTWRDVAGGRLIVAVAYNLRIFPEAFTSQDFGATTTTHSGREIAHGFTFGVRF